MKHIYAKTALLLAAIALFGGVLTWGMRAVRPPAEQREMFTVVASFYPVYIAAVNIAGDVDGVEVVNLVSNRAGCLHDYQMSPADRLTLEAADVLIENGAGAEPLSACWTSTALLSAASPRRISRVWKPSPPLSRRCCEYAVPRR